MSVSWFVDGNQYVAVRTGMPEHSVKIGLGRNYESAMASLEDTPMQSSGRDPVGAALNWASNAGWISDPSTLEDDDGPDLDDMVEDVEKACLFAQEWGGWEWSHDPGGHGIVLNGPGAVRSWQAYERNLRKSLRPEMIDDWQRMTRAEISEALDDVARAARQYGETAQDAADSARALGEDALNFAKRGRYKRALEAAEAAARIENEYGDAPLYNPLVEAIEVLVPYE